MAFTYRGLQAQYTRLLITEEEVDRQIRRLQQSHPRTAEVNDRPTQLGDEVILDYAGFCDGEQFAGGTAENQTLVLGSGTFIPGFEEQLLDKIPGEKVIVEVTFPQQYHSQALAGKAAQFHCVIHKIRISTPYELDDTFAQEVGGFYTLAEMRQKMQEEMQAQADQRGEMDLQDQLLRQASETLDYTPTEEQIAVAVEELMSHLKAQLAQQRLSLESYCTFMSTTEEKIREDFRETAIRHVKVQITVERIVELEKLEATQEDIGHAIALVARQNGMTVEEFKSYYDEELEAAIIRSILTSKVMRLIRDAAIIAEV